MSFTITHSYAKDSDILFRVLTDASYLVKKFEATGAKNVEVIECRERGGVFVITRKLDLPTNPPGFAKKFVKSTNTVIATDTWQSFDNPLKQGVFELDIKGVPISASGQIMLKPTKKGCDYIVVFEPKVRIPLIGGKIAQLVENDTRANQEKDYRFTRKYLESLE